MIDHTLYGDRDWRGVCVVCNCVMCFKRGIPHIALVCEDCSKLSFDDRFLLARSKKGCGFFTGLDNTSLYMYWNSRNPSCIDQRYPSRTKEFLFNSKDSIRFDSCTWYTTDPRWVRSRVAKESGKNNWVYRYERVHHLYHDYDKDGYPDHPLHILVVDYVHRVQDDYYGGVMG